MRLLGAVSNLGTLIFAGAAISLDKEFSNIMTKVATGHSTTFLVINGATITDLTSFIAEINGRTDDSGGIINLSTFLTASAQTMRTLDQVTQTITNIC